MNVDFNSLIKFFQSIDDLPPLRDVIRQNDLRADKKYGQNFLLDLNLTEKIVRAAGNLSNCHVIEIGPGPGGLTRPLIQSDAKHITAVEFDKRVIQALKTLVDAGGEKFTLIQADALSQNLLETAKEPRAIVANLPYNIATPLLIKWLRDIRDNHEAYGSMTLMFQKEVAQRITASLGNKNYGRLGVLCQWLCDVRLVFDVPASAFTPPPKVVSSIVHFKPKELDKNSPSMSTVEKITAAAFGQRRKMVRSSLSDYKQYFGAAGIVETDRAENISVDGFIKLALLSEEKI